MSLLKTKKCPICHNEFQTNSGVKVYCCKECARLANLDRLRKKNHSNILEKVAESRVKYPDTADSKSYTECKICGYRSGNLVAHLKLHNMTVETYKKIYNISKTVSEYNIENMINNNPAKEHGGRLSPFSKKFYKYEGLCDKEKNECIEKVINTQKKTLKDNPQKRKTRVEYWLKQGYTAEEAKRAVTERQITYSLEKCICKYGEEEGFKEWEKRQQKWLATLNAKSEEEKQDINRRKAAKVNFKTLWNKNLAEVNGTLYLIKLYNTNEEFYKIGITTRPINKRFNKLLEYNYDVLYMFSGSLQICFEKEQTIIKNNKDIRYTPLCHFSGYTECFSAIPYTDTAFV